MEGQTERRGVRAEILAVDEALGEAWALVWGAVLGVSWRTKAVLAGTLVVSLLVAAQALVWAERAGLMPCPAP